MVNEQFGISLVYIDTPKRATSPSFVGSAFGFSWDFHGDARIPRKLPDPLFRICFRFVFSPGGEPARVIPGGDGSNPEFGLQLAS